MTEPTLYPEHEKITGVVDERRALYDFLDWLTSSRGIALMERRIITETRPCPSLACDEGRVIRFTGGQGLFKATCPECHGATEVTTSTEGYFHIHDSSDDLVSQYLGLDQAKLEEERRHMLDALRSAQKP